MDPDQLASQKPAGLDLHCVQNRYIWVENSISYDTYLNRVLVSIIIVTYTMPMQINK